MPALALWDHCFSTDDRYVFCCEDGESQSRALARPGVVHAAVFWRSRKPGPGQHQSGEYCSKLGTNALVSLRVLPTKRAGTLMQLTVKQHGNYAIVRRAVTRHEIVVQSECD